MARQADQHLLFLLMMAYVAAIFLPASGRAIRSATAHSVPVPILLLAILLFAAGLGIDGRQLRVACKQWWLILAGQAVLWGAPLGAVLFLREFSSVIPTGTLDGLELVALMPAAASSVAWSQISRGNVAVTLGLLATSTLLSPFVIANRGQVDFVTAGNGVNLPTTASVVSLVGWVIPAFAAGASLRCWLSPARIAAIRPHLKLLTVSVLLVLNYANAATALPQIAADPQWGGLAIVSVLTFLICGISFLASWFLALGFRVEPPTRTALVFGLGMKNTGMALVFAGIWWESQPLATLAIILFTLMQHLLAATYHRLTLKQGLTNEMVV